MKIAAVLVCLITLASLGCSDDTADRITDPGTAPVPPAPLSWRHAQRTPVSELLQDIDGFDGTRIAVGEGGTILFKHGDGDWQVADREFDSPLRSVRMFDEKKAIIAATNRILRTEDAGITWEIVATSNTAVRAVSVFGTSAIVVGTQTIRLSDDTGETWRTPTGVVPSQTFVSVSHHTASIATASAIGGSRYRTIDGGETWTEVGVGEIPGTADHVAFFAEKLGTAAMGNPARVFFTDDRGDTWEEVANFGQGRITAIDVVGPEKAYAILGTGQIHVTENSGKTWAFATSVPPEDGIINGLDASDPNIWYAVGGVGFLAETRNGGNTWQHTSEGRIGTFKSVAFADANIGVAAFTPRLNFAEVALRTTDGGQTWIAVDPQMARPDRVVFSKSAQVGILIGSRFVSKSVNQGFTWENVSPPATDGLLGGAILDELTYIVCGHNSGLFRTTDGGGSWTDVSPSSGDRFEDVRFFPDRVTGLLVGPDASYRTLDGGVTWEVVNVRAVAVACIGNDVAVAIGNQILRSVDRGQNWTIVTTPAATMMTIAFADELQGFVAGVGGNVFETLDGGLSWALAPKETSVRLRSATFRDGRAAVAVGDGGAVLLGTP